MNVIFSSIYCQNSDPTGYLKAILLCKVDDGFSSFSGGVCCIEYLNTQQYIR